MLHLDIIPHTSRIYSLSAFEMEIPGTIKI